MRTTARFLLISIFCLTAVATPCVADNFPSKPVRVIVPFAPGGPTDVMARAVGEGFRERTGQPFVIENRPGANTLIGATACKNAPPDGYTLCLLSMTSMSLNPFLYGTLPYDPEKDFEAITNIAFTRQILLMHNSVPASNLKELVQYSKEHPEKLNFASFGIGSESQLVVEWLKKRTGAQLTHVPFPGAAPGLLAFERGDVQLFYLVASPAIVEKIRSGGAKGLLVPGSERNPDLPDVPSYKDAGLPVLDSKNWFGIFAPAGLPAEVLAKLGRELPAVIGSPDFQAKYIRSTGADSVGNSPADFREFLKRDRRSASELVSASGVHLSL